MTALALRWWRLIWWASRRSCRQAVDQGRHADALRLLDWCEHCATTVADLAELRHWRGR